MSYFIILSAVFFRMQGRVYWTFTAASRSPRRIANATRTTDRHSHFRHSQSRHTHFRHPRTQYTAGLIPGGQNYGQPTVANPVVLGTQPRCLQWVPGVPIDRGKRCCQCQCPLQPRSKFAFAAISHDRIYRRHGGRDIMSSFRVMPVPSPTQAIRTVVGLNSRICKRTSMSSAVGWWPMVVDDRNHQIKYDPELSTCVQSLSAVSPRCPLMREDWRIS